MGLRRDTSSATAGAGPGDQVPGDDGATVGRKVRALLWLATLPFAAITVVLLLSDRAPGAARRLLVRIENRGRRAEDRFGIDWIDLSDIPVGWKTAGHFLLWMCAGALAYGLFTNRWATWRIVTGVVILSIGSEVGQMLFTYSRELELHDIAANTVGIVVGVVGAVFLVRVYRALFRRRSLTG